MSTTPVPKVFVSYSHDSDAHSQRVRDLADRLRGDGIDCTLDQYEPAPPQGWPMWMDRQVDDADFVLVVSTETYHRRATGRERPGVGHGVRFESVLIVQDLYDAGMWNEKFIPVLLDGAKGEHIVKPLRPYTHYRADTDEGYEALYRQLTRQPAVVKPALGKRRVLPPKKARNSPFIVGPPIERDVDLFGRVAQRDELRDAVERGQSVQVLGERRMGKTSLLKWVGRHARSWQDRPVVWVNAQGLAGQSPRDLVLAVADGLGRRDETEKALEDGNAAAVMGGLLPVLLLVDEAAVLARDGHGFDAGFLGVLRDFCEKRQLVWVSASLVELMQLFRDTGLASDFLNNAREVRVGQLEEKAARDLVSRLEDDSAAELALTQAGGFAYGLQWLGDRLWRAPGDREAVCDAFADAMEKHFHRLWDGCTDADRKLLRRCVSGIARAGMGAADRRHALRLQRFGFLAERDKSFVVPGAAWRDFVLNA